MKSMMNLESRIKGLGLLLAALLPFSFFLFPSAALADGTSCWCRDAAWVCTHHRANQVIPGGASGDSMTDAQCLSFCEGQGKTPNLRPDYSSAGEFCRLNCVDAGSCAADDAITGVTPPQNVCIIRNLAFQLNVVTLEECCVLNREGAEGTPPTRVGYGGSVQTCPADPDAPATSVTTSGPIRLFNPLGADTDIPAFIGRGIRGVLGVIGAIALLMFVYGGVVWMTAGDSKRVEDAKNIIKNSVIGLLLIFFSYNLIGIFFDFFT